jgi:hypothetical protein
VSMKLNRSGLRKRYHDVLLKLRGVEGVETTKPIEDAKPNLSDFEQIILSILPNADWSKRLVEQGINSTTILTLTELCKGGNKMFVFFFFFLS